MTEEEARKLLMPADWVDIKGGDDACLDGYFTVEQLEACLFLMKAGARFHPVNDRER